MSKRRIQILVIVIAAALLGGSIMLRRAIRIPEPETKTVAQRTPPSRVAQVPTRSRVARAPLSDEGPISGSSSLASGPRTSAGQVPQPKTGDQKPETLPSGHDGTPGAEASAAGTPGAQNTGALTSSSSLSVSFEHGSANAADDTAPIIANNVEFDPTVGAIRLPPNAALAYPDSGGINTDAGTAALWVRPDWDSTQPSVKSLLGLSTGTWENRLDLQIGLNYLRFMLTTSDGTEHPVGVAGDFASGEWHHIAVTWGDEILSLYVDGALKEQSPYTGSAVIPPGTPLYVGTTRGGPRPGILSLRSLNVFQRQLAPEEIAVLLDQTAPTG